MIELKTFLLILSENLLFYGEIYIPSKNFTLPPAVTAWTNLTSDLESLKTPCPVVPPPCSVNAMTKVGTSSPDYLGYGDINCRLNAVTEDGAFNRMYILLVRDLSIPCKALFQANLMNCPV